MQDMVDLYRLLLTVPDEKIAGKIFNAGYQNYTVAETAAVIRDVVRQEMPEKGEIEIVTTPSDDIRSYRINSDKITRELGFVPKRTIEDGARDLIDDRHPLFQHQDDEGRPPHVTRPHGHRKVSRHRQQFVLGREFRRQRTGRRRRGGGHQPFP
jgi:hypothetical protein